MTLRAATKRPNLVLALLMTLGLVAAACGTEDEAAVTTPSADFGSGSASSVVLPTVGGGQLDFGSLEGTDAVLWFWAPW